MTVFVVSFGEKYEGGRILGIKDTLEKAQKLALEQETCFDGGWVPKKENYWENGCDFISVEEFEVQ